MVELFTMANSKYEKLSCCLACIASANVLLDIVLLIPTLIIYCIQLFSLFRHSLIPTGGDVPNQGKNLNGWCCMDKTDGSMHQQQHAPMHVDCEGLFNTSCSFNFFFLPPKGLHFSLAKNCIIFCHLGGRIIKESAFWLRTPIYFVPHSKTLYPHVHCIDWISWYRPRPFPPTIFFTPVKKLLK